MDKFIIVLFGFIIGFSLTILTMIYGWGLEPKSWWWIVGCGIGMKIVAEILTQVGRTWGDK